MSDKSRSALATRRRADQNKDGESIRSERGRLATDLEGAQPGDILIIGPNGEITFMSLQGIQDLIEKQAESLAVLVKILTEVHDLDEECIRDEVQLDDGT